MRRCVLLRQAVAAEAGPDEQDTLRAATAVAAALSESGWAVEELAIGLDLSPVVARLKAEPPKLVFNLVESLPGVAFPGPAGLAAAAMLEGLGLPFTGSGLAALALSSEKPAAKRVLRAGGVPVPPGPAEGWPGPFIIKHRSEHASFGLGKHSVVPELGGKLPSGWFAEAFLPGREFNISLLAGKDGLAALPPAELIYDEAWPPPGAPDGMPRILDYAGKWQQDDPLFPATHRRFVNIDEEVALLLTGLARRAFDVLGLAGYGRVDFRLDLSGVAHVLEVNANPALTPDAGFAAAANEAGIGYPDLINRIAEVALGNWDQAAWRAERLARDRRRWIDQRRESLAQTSSETRIGLHSQPDTGLGPRLTAVALRKRLLASDVEAIGALCRASGFFVASEIAVALELARSGLAEGERSGYWFLLAEQPHGCLLGYVCFGPVPASEGAWDLYWIVVHPGAQGAGLGRRLVAAAAAEAGAAGGRILYAETAGRALYAPTRNFYRACGFSLQAVLTDFYAPGDAKQVWTLRLGQQATLRMTLR